MGQVGVGTASWTDRTLLEAGWYPPEADTPEHPLRYYARQFGLVEVDATYCALPAEQTCCRAPETAEQCDVLAGYASVPRSPGQGQPWLPSAAGIRDPG
jgi:hypothetical protein